MTKAGDKTSIRYLHNQSAIKSINVFETLKLTEFFAWVNVNKELDKKKTYTLRFLYTIIKFNKSFT